MKTYFLGPLTLYDKVDSKMCMIDKLNGRMNLLKMKKVVFLILIYRNNNDSR